MKEHYTAWAVQWRSGPNNLDRKVVEHLLVDWGTPTYVAEKCLAPIVFPTRGAARAWVKERYGYLRARRDLRAYPHDWKPPRVVRVSVKMEIM